MVGLAFGGMRSARRGTGSDVAGSRPYRPGDDIDEIDWAASARLSSARGTDEFVVRERFADEAPRVAILCDRRPSMSFFPEGWPWLSKPAAVAHAVDVIWASAVAARGVVGYLDHADGDRFWRPPNTQRRPSELDRGRPFGAPEDALEVGLRELVRQRRDLPSGSFVFVLSDFLVRPSRDVWLDVVGRRWDVVPVVVQDPVWERSFPDVSGVVVPFADPATGRLVPTGLTQREAREHREENERRWSELLRELRSLALEPVVVDSDDPRAVLRAFLAWADLRVYARGRTW